MTRHDLRHVTEESPSLIHAAAAALSKRVTILMGGLPSCQASEDAHGKPDSLTGNARSGS